MQGGSILGEIAGGAGPGARGIRGGRTTTVMLSRGEIGGRCRPRLMLIGHVTYVYDDVTYVYVQLRLL